MTYQISKEFHFSASHQLNGLPAEHQCARLHGHNYILRVTLQSEELDSVGFIKDYGELTYVKQLVDRLDHRHLNDLFDFNPTSENVCRYYADTFARYYANRAGWQHITVIAVELSETPKTWAKYIAHMSDFQ